MTEPSRRSADRIANVLLTFAAAGLTGTLIFAFAWYRAVTRDVRLADLRDGDRQALVEEVGAVLPGAYAATFFEPRIGYTLLPGQRVDLGYDAFIANDLGYRTGVSRKKPGTFRVVFVGDSWTFGHGVPESESFPVAFEEAARQAGVERSVEAWTLALSGYNTFNQLAALEYFADRLEPDAVVICPSTNDNDSGLSVLPDGRLTRQTSFEDLFGDGHSVSYRHIGVDSYRYRERWRAVFRELATTEGRWRDSDVPWLYFFVAQWPESVVHHLVGEAGLRAPYLINPEQFRVDEWLNPAPWGHGNPEANRIYGRIVYQGLAETLGWPKLELAGDASDLELFRGPPAGEDWEARATAALAVYTERFIEESFQPSRTSPKQCVGPLSCETGLVGRAATVLVRKRARARFLAVELGRIPGSRRLYPLAVTVTVPSPNGGTRARVTMLADGLEPQRAIVEIPTDVSRGAALDVILEAERAAATDRRTVPGSVFLRSIEQLDDRPPPAR